MIDFIYVDGKKVDMHMVQKIKDQFQCEVLEELPKDKDMKYLQINKDGITFVSGKLSIKGDFTKMLPRVTRGHLQHEILLKAAKQNNTETTLRAIDCTAGLGEDAFILAAGGYEVEMFEHNPVTALLLKDALQRAKSHPELKDIVSKMTLKQGDSKDLLSMITYTPDLIYLDPMYPEKKKKSAETKKKLQVLHTIESYSSDEDELLQAALHVKPKKIVIKRPADGPFLGNKKPSYQITRKAVRFDCIVL